MWGLAQRTTTKMSEWGRLLHITLHEPHDPGNFVFRIVEPLKMHLEVAEPGESTGISDIKGHEDIKRSEDIKPGEK